MDLRSPAVRWSIGLYGGVAIAAISYYLLEGTAQQLGYLIAVIDFITTPLVLKYAIQP